MIKTSKNKMRFTCTVIALSLGLCLAAVVTAAEESDSHAPKASAEDHGEGHAPNTNPLSFDPDLALFTGLVFLLLLLVLWKFAWGPISSGLDKREQSIAGNIEEAKASLEKANATLKEYESQLASAAAETKEMLEAAKRDAAAVREKAVNEAQEAAQRERERAVADINVAKNQALQEVAGTVTDLSIALASQIVRREVNASDHANLVTEALQQLPSSN